MDIISHGIWGSLILGKKSSPWWAAAWGMLPDAIAFIPYLTAQVAGGKLAAIAAAPQTYPPWVTTVYNCTHSLLIAGIVFYILCHIRLDLGLSFLAWPLHILLDIPTHTAASFPTKFLFPLSHLHLDGVSWRNAYIFLANWLAIIIVSGLLILKLKALHQE
jgi:hypothetical protein